MSKKPFKLILLICRALLKVKVQNTVGKMRMYHFIMTYFDCLNREPSAVITEAFLGYLI